MVEISPGLYVSDDVTDEQREQLLSSIQQAKSQVMQVYGSVISCVIIYACGDRECYESFNGHGDGRAIGDSGILLMPRSFIPEAISHEWSHVELHTRVGSAGYRKLPMWFHQGLAVVVSKLPNHSEKVLRLAEQLGLPVSMDVKHFGGLAAWKSALKQYHNYKDLNVLYAAAGQEVRKWLKGVGTEGLIQLIDAVDGGENFIAAYERLENVSHQKNSDENYATPHQITIFIPQGGISSFYDYN